MCLSDSAIFTCIGNCWLDSLDQFLLHSLTALMFKSCMLIKMQTSDNPTSDVQMKGSMAHLNQGFKGFIWPRSLGKLPVDVKELLGAEVKNSH